MQTDSHTPVGAHVVELIDEVLRLRGRLLSATRNLTAGTGIRSLSQGLVLNAVVRAKEPPTVARIGRSLGYTRQAIQRVADELAAAGYLRFEDNPHHKRAMQLVATGRGLTAYRQSNDASVEWADRAGSALGKRELARTVTMLRRIRRYLEETADGDDNSSRASARARAPRERKT